jgi:hypothetical protein
LRDIKANRVNLLSIDPDDLAALVKLGLVEMRGESPTLTDEGRLAIA